MFPYVVRPGDTLWSIANRFGTTVQAIMQVNNLTSPFVFVGQTIYIPTQIPGPSPGPGPDPGPDQGQLRRLEQRVNRLEAEVNQLNRRVRRLEGN